MKKFIFISIGVALLGASIYAYTKIKKNKEKWQSVNNTTNSHSKRIIFGHNKNTQNDLVYEEEETVNEKIEEKEETVKHSYDKVIFSNIDYKTDEEEYEEIEENYDDDLEEDDHIDDEDDDINPPDEEYEMIDRDTFTGSNIHYEKLYLTYYEEDCILADERNEVILDPGVFLGPFELEEITPIDKSIIYIRNNVRKMDIEVEYTNDSYHRAVLGYDIDEANERNRGGKYDE